MEANVTLANVSLAINSVLCVCTLVYARVCILTSIPQSKNGFLSILEFNG